MEISIIVAIVAGLFSLLGAFVGAYLARRTQYEKWLLENRSEVFAKFLVLMHEAGDKATDILAEKPLDALKLVDAYSGPLNYANVVRLYLPKSERKKFQQLARDISALHSNKDLGDSRVLTMENKLNEIQEIFERNV